MKIAERMRAILPSATLSMAARAQALRASGVDVAPLSAGEPDFDTPEPIRQAAHAAIDRGDTRYTPVAGTSELRRAVAAFASKLYGRNLDSKETMVSVGAKQVLFNACAALLNPGDEAVVIAPFWVSYPDMIRFAGGKPVIVDTDEANGFAPDLKRLAAAFNSRTRMLILNSPNNPSGMTFDSKTLSGIAGLLRDHPEVFCITDDIYYALTYDRPFASIAQVAPDLAERILIVTGVSKTYAMTGWRIGFGIGPVPVIGAMTNLQGASTSGATSIAQAAACAALTGDQSAVESMRLAFQRRRDRMVKALRSIPDVKVVEPGGAFYAFPNVARYYNSRIKSSQTLCEHLLDQAHVAAVPGDAFGSDAHIRLSFACSEAQIDEGVQRIAKALGALR